MVSSWLSSLHEPDGSYLVTGSAQVASVLLYLVECPSYSGGLN